MRTVAGDWAADSEEGKQAMTQSTITDETISHLPSPVQRSLRRSGVIGKGVPERVSLRQTGELLIRDRWLPFTAEEDYTLIPASFRWQGVVKLGGIPIARAEDSLSDGRGRMHVRVLGLFTVVDETGPEMDQGSLMRWLNETMWFPHVWATGAISWEAVDEVTAVGVTRVGDVRVQAAFHFDTAGRLVDFHGDRYRIDDSGSDLVAWATPLTGHDRFDGIEVPSSGSGIWTLGSQELEYIRLQVTDLRYT